VAHGAVVAATHVLESGLSVTIRTIQPSDRAALREEFLRLSPESRYRRFFAHMADLSDDVLTYLTEVDGVDHVALIALVESPDLKTERGVGVARFIRTAEDPKAAEAAVTVIDDMQHRGVGRSLGGALVEAARERGIERFAGEVLETNEPMLRALREAGAVLRRGDPGVLRFDVSIAAEHEPLLFRLFREIARSIPGLLLRLRPPRGRA
jgi:GNAT superfamily N-acetyltransferase